MGDTDDAPTLRFAGRRIGTESSATTAPRRIPSRWEQQHLLTVACHDLCEPLNAISLTSEAALLKLRHGEPLPVNHLVDLLTRIQRLASAGSTLVSDVLSVQPPPGRTPPGPFATDVEEALAGAIALQHESLQRAGCQIVVTRSEGGDRICGPWDRRYLVTIFSNLLQNAHRHASGAPISIDIRRTEEGVQISFADGGPGLPVGPEPSDPERTTNFGHHGLGLWIVRASVALLGGRIVARTDLDKGLGYEICLPD
jgi:signal transduction histidine kinase